MNEMHAKEEIALIRSMIERTRKATAESGTLFIFWGVLMALALVGNSILVHLEKSNWVWVNWVALTVVGWAYSMIYRIRRDRKEPVRSYVQAATHLFHFSCGMTYILVGIVFPALKVYSYAAIPILIAAVSGIHFLVIGGILEWPLLKGMGFLWWVGAVGMSFFKKGSSRLLVFTILFIVAFLIPSFILKAKYKREMTTK